MSYKPDRAGQLTREVAQLRYELAQCKKQLGDNVLSGSDEYCTLFNDVPISLWEEDFSALKTYFESLRQNGVTDFRAYFDQHPEAVFYCVGLVKILRVNQATLTLYQARDEADLLQNLARVFTDASYPQFKTELIALAEGRTNFEVEGETSTLQGRKVFVKLRMSLVRGYEDTWARALISVTDITERKQVEEALIESQKRYQALFEQANDAIFVETEDDEIIEVNRRACDLLGYSREELLQLRVPDLQAPETRGQVGQVVRAELVLPGPFETVNLHRDGTRIPVEVSTSLITTQGEKRLGISIVRDITRRKRVETTLKRYAARLETFRKIDRDILAARMPQDIAAVALNHIRQMIPCLRASVTLFDHSTRQVRILAAHADGQTRLGPSTLLPLHHFPQEFIQSGQLHTVNHLTEVPARTPLEQNLLDEGVRSYINVPLKIQQELFGSINVGAAVPAAFTDEHLEIVEEVADSLAVAIQHAQLYEQARHDAEAKAALLREVNHRVKNNLAAIIGLLYVEQNHAGLEKQPAYRAIMADLINRIEGLATVHQMLSASQWSPLPLDELVRQIIQSVLQTLPSSQPVTLTVNSAAPVYVMPSQANGLAMLINELATNTAKYAVTRQPKVTITVTIKQLEENLVYLEYRDDGPGFPDTVLSNQQYNVGLYLVKNIVHSDLLGQVTLHNDHGGVVTVQFKLRRGEHKL